MVRCASGARGGFIELLLEASLVVVAAGATRLGSGVQYVVENGSIAYG
jgi:hypothetical protein